MSRTLASSKGYSIEKLYSICGPLPIAPRREKITLIQWLYNNYTKFDPILLQKHYGLFIRYLRNPEIPVKCLVDFIICITDKSTVTQSRINFVVEVFQERDNSPSIARLLKVMRSECSRDLYVPPLGQENAAMSLIPMNTIRMLKKCPDGSIPEGRNVAAAKICTTLYMKLDKARKSSDIEFSELLAQMVPLVQQIGRIPAPIEKCIYEYLEYDWKLRFKCSGTYSIALIASEYFRFWPLNNLDAIRIRLIQPLFQAQSTAAVLILPYLWYFGAYAISLMETFYTLLRPQKYTEWQQQNTIIRYMHIYQFYKVVSDSDCVKKDVVSDMIMHQIGYFPLCTQWAHAVPDICQTIQGNFSLIKKSEVIDILNIIFSETSNQRQSSRNPNTTTASSSELAKARTPTDLDLRFHFANTAWLGGYTQRTYSKLKVQGKSNSSNFISSQRPAFAVTKIDDETLVPLGLTLSSFCSQLVQDLLEEGIDILPYLEILDTNGGE